MPGSMLVVQEYFASGDPRFLDELRAARSPADLRRFAPTWLGDPRPWAREQLGSYLDAPLDTPGHEPLIKALFKHAEKTGDDAAMARFMAAFDRSVRRTTRTSWNWRFGAAMDVHRVRNTTLTHLDERGRPLTKYPLGNARPPNGRLFTVHTRNYLRRRAWRYFRRMGFRDPARYLAQVVAAAIRYRDEDCDSGIHFLDNWGLMHVLFAHAPILRKTGHAWWVRDGFALRDLKPAPAFPSHWSGASAAALEMLRDAKARPVRRWAMAFFKAHPELTQKLPAADVARLLLTADPEVQAFGADLLGTAAGLESLPMELWHRLLETANLDVLDLVCDLVRKVVSPERFTTEQLLGFAIAPLGPVANLGISRLDSRPLTIPQVLELAGVRAASAAEGAVALARRKLPGDDSFDPMWVLAFLDSATKEVRAAAWAWFAGETRARNRVDLWAKIVETPYDDVRFELVRHLERFADTDPGLRVLRMRAPLETVWATVLLNIERGSRVKRLVARQIAETIERQPDRAAQLLPLLRIAARSIRAPEFRAGLAAVVRVATNRPEIAAALAAHDPGLKL